VTTRPSNTDVLEALAQTEIKLTALITTGLAQIKDEHARSLLEQAKLNATFASRDALTDMRRQLDANSNALADLNRRAGEADADRKDLRTSFDRLSELVSSRTISTYDRWTGWLLTGGFSILAVSLSVVLNHIVK
jgi:hypothetical protein